MNEPRIYLQINLEFKNEKRKSSAKNVCQIKENEKHIKTLYFIHKLKIPFLKVLKCLIFHFLVVNSLQSITLMEKNPFVAYLNFIFGINNEQLLFPATQSQDGILK